MSFKSLLVVCLIFSPLAMAQTGATHDVVIHFGNFDIDERGEHYLAIMRKQDGTIITEPSEYDWASEVLRISETMHLGKYFAVEGGLAYFGESSMKSFQQEQVGTDEDDNPILVDRDITLSVRFTSFDLGAVGKLPLFDNRVTAYARLGANYSRGEYTIDSRLYNADGVTYTDTRLHQDETDFAAQFGAGLYTVVKDRMVVRLDYNSGKLDQVDTSYVTLGLGFRYE